MNTINNLVVTGGAGFIGNNFARYWLDIDPSHKVCIVDCLTYAGKLGNILDLDRSRVQFIQENICTVRPQFESAIERCDAIVHFAAETHVDNSITGPTRFAETNVMGTLNLLELARKYNKRFHQVGTDEVFGALELGSGTRFCETTPYDPRSPYSATKAAADHLVRAYFHTYGLPVTISSCSNNYGPYQHPEKMIPTIITSILRGQKIPVYGDGLYVRDWLFVIDHCRAIALILQKGKPGETYCIGGMTEDVSNLDLVRLILKIMGASENLISYVKDRPGHDRRYAIDWSRAQRELGYKPLKDFHEGLVYTVDWYRSRRKWWEKSVA